MLIVCLFLRDGRMKKLRIALIMGMILIAFGSNACAASYELSSGLDIVGSKADMIQVVSSCEKLKLDIVGSMADDVRIYSPYAAAEDVEIVGSTATNISLYSTPPIEECCARPPVVLQPVYINTPEKKYEPHLGVDAWYGRYWYASDMYMPKWPRSFD
jgi:hypothetical protein